MKPVDFLELCRLGIVRVKLLAIETSTSICSVALIQDGLILASRGEQVEFGHSTPLAEMTKNVLEDTDTDIVHLDAIGISIGPGSLTGLRIGLAFGKGICSAATIPIVAIPTLHGLVYNILKEGVLIRPIVRAKKGQYHTALYEYKSETQIEIEPHQIISSDFLNKEIFRRTVLIGETFTTSESNSLSKMYELYGVENSPIAEGIAKLGEKMFSEGETSNSAELEPDYKMEFKAKAWNREQSGDAVMMKGLD